MRNVMSQLFEYRQHIGRYDRNHLHSEFYHDGYCSCHHCTVIDYIPSFCYLKAYKLKMLYFDALKLVKGNRHISYNWAVNKIHKHEQEKLAKGFVLDVDAMAMIDALTY